jgi:hypothetical protein
MFAITGLLPVTPSGERAGSRTSRVAHCQGPEPNKRDTSREVGTQNLAFQPKGEMSPLKTVVSSIFYRTFCTSGANFHSISVAWHLFEMKAILGFLTTRGRGRSLSSRTVRTSLGIGDAETCRSMMDDTLQGKGFQVAFENRPPYPNSQSYPGCPPCNGVIRGENF